MASVKGENLKNYDFLKKLEKCCGFSANLFQARFSNESMNINLKKATMVLSWQSIMEGLLGSSENSSSWEEFLKKYNNPNKNNKSPFTLEKFLKKCRNFQNISEYKINDLLNRKDPIACFVKNRNKLTSSNGYGLESIRIIVLDIFEGNRFGFFKNFFQKLTVYDTNGNEAELKENGNNDNKIQKILEGNGIRMLAKNSQELLIPDWKKDWKDGKLLFFITYKNDLYSVEYSGAEKVTPEGNRNWKKYVLGAAGLAALGGAAYWYLNKNGKKDIESHRPQDETEFGYPFSSFKNSNNITKTNNNITKMTYPQLFNKEVNFPSQLERFSALAVPSPKQSFNKEVNFPSQLERSGALAVLSPEKLFVKKVNFSKQPERFSALAVPSTEQLFSKEVSPISLPKDYTLPSQEPEDPIHEYSKEEQSEPKEQSEFGSHVLYYDGHPPGYWESWNWRHDIMEEKKNTMGTDNFGGSSTDGNSPMKDNVEDQSTRVLSDDAQLPGYLEAMNWIDYIKKEKNTMGTDNFGGSSIDGNSPHMNQEGSSRSVVDAKGTTALVDPDPNTPWSVLHVNYQKGQPPQGSRYPIHEYRDPYGSYVPALPGKDEDKWSAKNPLKTDNTMETTTNDQQTTTDSPQPHKGMFLENAINRWSGKSKDKNKGMFLERGFNWLLGNK
jgi:hypothetical protein